MRCGRVSPGQQDETIRPVLAGHQQAQPVFGHRCLQAGEGARATMTKVPMLKDTIPYQVIGRFGSSRVLLKPASPGTGDIALRPVGQAPRS